QAGDAAGGCGLQVFVVRLVVAADDRIAATGGDLLLGVVGELADADAGDGMGDEGAPGRAPHRAFRARHPWHRADDRNWSPPGRSPRNARPSRGACRTWPPRRSRTPRRPAADWIASGRCGAHAAAPAARKSVQTPATDHGSGSAGRHTCRSPWQRRAGPFPIDGWRGPETARGPLRKAPAGWWPVRSR